MAAVTYAMGVAGTTIVGGLHRHWLAVALAALLHFGDVLSTHLALRVGLAEINLVPASVMALHGETVMYGLKLTAVATVILLICLLERRYPKLWHAVHVTNGMMAAVVLSNSVQVLMT